MSYEAARVVWSEGLFLRPQHFQQQERFIEWSVQSRLRQLLAYAWGFSELTIDGALLRSSKLALKSAAGLLPDGTPIELPSEASPVKPLDVPPNTRDEVVYLHAVLQRADAKAVALDEDSARTRRTRYLALDASLADNVLGMESEADVKLGILILTLSFKSELDGSMTSLPVARVIERKGSFVELDERFVPPLLDALAHRVVKDWIVELHGVVKQRAELLEGRLGQAGGKGVSDLLLLQLCNRYQPLLAQWCAGGPMHPFLLHQELLKFAGECSTFDVKSRRPSTFPAYDHNAIAAVLFPLVEAVRRAMVTVAEQTATLIPLRDRGQGLFSAEIADARMITGGYFVLAVSAQWPERRLRDEIPGQIRIGDPDKMAGMNRAAISSIRVAMLPGAPVEIRYQNHFVYFILDRESEDWKSIAIKRQLALFVAGDPPGLELELWSIRTA